MDCCFGILGKDFALVAADGSIAYSIMKLSETEDKLIQLDDRKVLGLVGEVADRNQFGEYVHKNLELTRYKTGNELSTKEAANFIRYELAQAIRRAPYQVNAILGGVDQDGKADLYWMDYLGSLQRITKGAHGYGANFIGGLLDNQWKKDMTEAEAIALAEKCAAEIRTRFLLSSNCFWVKIVSKNGIQILKI